MPEILQWVDIQNHFQHGLLLGNGSSIAVNESFRYDSLFEAATNLGHITENVAEVFHNFGVNDFELVLKRLWQAKLVNDALEIESERIDTAYEEIRNALISTVRDIHVTYEDALPHLEPIYKFMQRFKTILSLNYDLIVYWAAMYGNREIRRWFKDCFQARFFREDWETLRQPFGAAGCSLFFYPHGNLVLIRRDFANDEKIQAGFGADLADEILGSWETGEQVPVFVCEGLVEHKLNSIYDSSYMSRVYHEVTPNIGESLVIYGWKMADQDNHIMEQLSRSNVQRVAISIYDNDQGFADYAEARMQSIGIQDICFFDSTSPGCWNNPIEDVAA